MVRKTIRDELCLILHTVRSRVTKKFKNHFILRQFTYTAQEFVVEHDTELMGWKDLTFKVLKGHETQMLHCTYEELRAQFLKSLRFEVYFELKLKNALI